MPEFSTRLFGYAHSHAVMAGLKAFVQGRNLSITDGYAYIDKPGEDAEFWKMIEVAKLGGDDILYIDSVRDFAGNSLADFKAALTAIADAGMKVVSMTERDYDYRAFMTAIGVLEDLTPAYQTHYRHIAAVTMHAMGADVSKICADLELSAAEVYEAIASYERQKEEYGIE